MRRGFRSRLGSWSVLALVVGAAFGGVTGAGHGQERPLPPGHPPTTPPAPAVKPPPAGSGSGANALHWTPPSSWVAETPASAMRRAQYRIPGKGGEADCVVFYFGPGEGGDAKANVARWAGQFRRADGSPIGDGVKTRELHVGGIPVVLVEIVGTYVGGMGGGPAGPARADHMLLGAIVEGPDARWFFRATGPRATLEDERPGFEKMIRSIRRGQGA